VFAARASPASAKAVIDSLSADGPARVV